MVHNDIKPTNILIDQNKMLYLIDFESCVNDNDIYN